LGRIADAMHSPVKLTATDTDVFNELATLLSPFKQITEKLESECTVTSSQVLPNIIGLELMLKKIDTRYTTSVKTGLLVSLQTRFTELQQNEQLITATVLDPAFQLRWCRTPDEEVLARSIVLRLLDAINLLVFEIRPVQDSSVSDSVTESADDLLSYMKQHRTTD
jgi:hypothetical protein